MPRVMETDVLILGAGLAGLSCAWHLGGRRDYVLVEKEPAPGGLARSRLRDGFTFDVTGHWFHSGEGEIASLVDSLLPEPLVLHRRRTGIHMCGVYLPYPFQANLAALPPHVKAECLLGFIAARFGPPRAAPDTFDDWIRAHLGDGIADHFMVPYNTKVWTVPPREMGGEWCRRFVPVPDVAQVVRGAVDRAQEGIGYHATFKYPARGGIGALPAAFAAHLPQPPWCGVAATGVDLDAGRAHLSDGREVHFRRLVSTIPLRDLVAILAEPPAAVRDAGGKLRANRVTYYNLGVRDRTRDETKAHRRLHWIYFPEARPVFYRVGAASQVEPALAPPGTRSLCAEVAHQDDVDVDATRDAVMDGLVACDLIDSRDDVLFADAHEIAPAYVIPDADFAPARNTLLEYFSSRGVHLAGRYGRWDYTSMSDAIADGRDTARSLCAEC
jgi:protoporphyrinogen oxidase